MHGSDNFRISLRGSFVMGPESYGPGEFRFQDGWRMYPSDNNSNGPEGGWEFIVMADRRGFRRRGVVGWDTNSPEGQGEIALQHYIAKMFEFDGDLVDADASVKPGPAALQTTLGRQSSSGKLNGSFANKENWTAVSDATTAVVSVLGEPTSGPVVILSETKPHEIAMAACSFDTELVRIVTAGSCSIDGRIYEAGDIRVQLPGKPSGPVSAGPDGLQEVLILGDRRYAAPTVTDGDAWPATLGHTVEELLKELANRGALAAS
jgi:hypothetical protein